MKKIKIKFFGLGYKNNNQANILIYDECNLIYSGQTYNGELEINLNRNKIYRICAYVEDEMIDGVIYTNKDIHCFSFNRSLIKVQEGRPITFILTDYYYNLPIEKGELILWQEQ